MFNSRENRCSPRFFPGTFFHRKAVDSGNRASFLPFPKITHSCFSDLLRPISSVRISRQNLAPPPIRGSRFPATTPIFKFLGRKESDGCLRKPCLHPPLSRSDWRADITPPSTTDRQRDTGEEGNLESRESTVEHSSDRKMSLYRLPLASVAP